MMPEIVRLSSVAAALLTIAVCLVIHAFVLFGVLRWQLWFRRRYPAARGAWLCPAGVPARPIDHPG